MSTDTMVRPKAKVPIRRYADLLVEYLRPQVRLVVMAGVLLLIGICLQILNPQIMRYLIDEAQAGSPLSRLLAAAGVFAGIAIIQQGINVAATYASEKVGWIATNRLRGDVARHCMYLDMSFHNERTPGEMIERTDGDASGLGRFFSTFIIQILGSSILVLGTLVMLVLEDWRAGLALTSFVAIMLVILASTRNLFVERYRQTREASTEVFALVEERLAGREEVRTNAAQSYVMRGFYELMRNLFRKYMMATLMLTIATNTTRLSFGLGNVVALAVGSYLFLNGSITIGAAYLIVHYTNMISDPIDRLVWQFDSLQRAGASIIRISELLQIKPAVVDGPGVKFPKGPLRVKFDNVSFGYNEGETVLHNVFFDLQPGRVLGLIGRTGSGKTTITRLLFRLYDPKEGHVLLGEHDIRDARIVDLREKVAMVTQDVRLFYGSVRDNLTFYDRAVSDERLVEVIGDVGLGPWFRALPNGVDTVLHGDGGLSAGEAQLLAFARAFLRDPQLVILDEATSRLDRSTEQLIEKALDKLVQDRSVIIIAHHLPTLERCDEITIIEGGRVVEHGDRKKLASDPQTRFHGLLKAGLEEMLA